MGLVVTLFSSKPDKFSVDFLMLSTIFPLNNLLFNLLIFDVALAVVCFVLPPTAHLKPSQANRLRSKGKLLRHRARRAIDLFFFQPIAIVKIKFSFLSVQFFPHTVFIVRKG